MRKLRMMSEDQSDYKRGQSLWSSLIILNFLILYS
ncbi:hypothetical protein UNH65_06715 [Chitinophaga sp. 180180018-2]